MQRGSVKSVVCGGVEREMLGLREEVLAIILFSNSRRFGVTNCGASASFVIRPCVVGFLEFYMENRHFSNNVIRNDLDRIIELKLNLLVIKAVFKY